MKLNLGCGLSMRSGGDWVNADKRQSHPDVMVLDVDKDGLAQFEDNYFDEIICHGCLNEFRTEPLYVMNELWRILANGGKLDVQVAVLDNGPVPLRDPLSNHPLHSLWVQYFIEGGRWENSGKGLGFIGQFKLLSETLGGEVHRVILEAVK